MDREWSAAGRARGTVALLHGVTSSAATWWRVGPALARRGWRVIAFDLPGHGDCPAPVEPLTLDALVASVVDRLPGGGVDVLVGHSLGGVVGAAAAARSGVARAVVLEDPPGLRALDPYVFAHTVAADLELVGADPGRLATRFRTLNPRWSETDVETVVAALHRVDATNVVSGLRAAMRWDVPELVGAVDVPVLVLAAAERASALRGEDRSAVRAALPPGRFVELASGHAVHRDRPAEWVDAVAGFAATLA